MKTQMPDEDSFNTLFMNLPAIHSLSLEMFLQTANFNWLYGEGIAHSDKKATDAAHKIEIGFPLRYKSIFSKGNALDTAIKQIDNNAKLYPEPFTGKDSPFPGLIADLWDAYYNLIPESTGDILSALTSSDYSKALRITNYLRYFSESLFRIEIFYHGAMASMKGNSTKLCPLFSQVIKASLTIPRLDNIKWAFFYLVMQAQFTCSNMTSNLEIFIGALMGYTEKLFTEDGGVRDALQYISENLDQFLSCYPETQIILPRGYNQYLTLASTPTGGYMGLDCQMEQSSPPTWSYPERWEPYLDYMSTIKRGLGAYLQPCLRNESKCYKKTVVLAPFFGDMITVFDSLIPAASARSAFVTLDPITYWFGDTFNEPALGKAGHLGNTLLGQVITSSLSDAMSSLMTNVSELPSSIQTDFKTLHGYYETISGSLSKKWDDFVGEISSLATNLASYTDLLAKIRNNYFDAVFSPSTEENLDNDCINPEEEL